MVAVSKRRHVGNSEIGDNQYIRGANEDAVVAGGFLDQPIFVEGIGKTQNRSC